MNSDQMRALNTVLDMLNRVTDKGLGHTQRREERERLMATRDDRHPKMLDKYGVEAQEPKASVYPFVVTGKIVVEFGPEKGKATDVATLSIGNDGMWGVEFSKPAPKKRVVRRTTMTPEAEATLRQAQAPKKPGRKPMSTATKKAAAAKRAATIAAKKAAAES